MEKTRTTDTKALDLKSGQPFQLQGLYTITQATTDAPEALATRVELAIQGGAKIIQYRDKGTDKRLRLDQARLLVEICKRHHIPLIINDDVDLASEVRAAGVHLGHEDASCQQARDQLGHDAIIGISCYNELSRAQLAQEQGANYVAFGRFFASSTKPQAVQADLALLDQARQQLQIPIAAIGGITPSNGRSLVEAGAQMLAVIDAVFGQQDIAAAAKQFQQCFE